MKSHGYLHELVQMTPRDVISWHSREHLKLVCAKGFLSSCHRDSTIIPDVRSLESTFSFCFSPALSLLLRGGTSSTDGVRDTPLAGAEVGEDGSAARIGTPLSVIQTDLIPMADRGSSFLPLILAYISLLNFVVTSARIKHLSKKKNCLSKHREKCAALTNPGLNLFSLNLNKPQHVHRRIHA